MGWRTLAGIADGGTAVCAALNTAYFFDRLLSGAELTPSRRFAVGVLAVISLGTLVEAAALLAAGASGSESALLGSAPWAAVRVVPFAGAAGVSALILRSFLR
jgi:hypothetical protein